MLSKIIRFFKRRMDTQGENPWLSEKPMNKTLGANMTLPFPNVCQPSDERIKGEELPEFPGYIAIEVTNACNLECRHCNYRYGLSHYTRDRGFMAKETLERILNEIKKYGIPALMNYDGEPLMHKDFLSYLRMTADLGINSYFNTNGTLFDESFSNEVIKFYKGSIFFSIDGSKEWFEKIRVPANYDHVVRNLEYFIRVNESHGWPITIGISLCNLGQTASERKAFIEKWLPQVNYVSMGEVNDKFGKVISKPMTPLKIKKRPVCSVPWETCGICHNGDVIPCSIYVTRANTSNAIFGNIWEQSLKEIWQGKKFRDFRSMLADKRHKQSFCDKCERWISQFVFPQETQEKILISRNGLWTTFHNTEKGPLNFQKQ